MSGLEKNQVHRVTIEGYSSEGLGVARMDGQVVFVHNGVRGEVCDILILKVLKQIAFAKVIQVLEPSGHRQEPDCPYFGSCGGCALRHLRYEEELWCKRQRVQDALTRLGGCSVTVETIHPASQPLRYRNKAQYPLSPKGEAGFYKARTHQVIPVTDCLLQSEEAGRLAQAVTQWMRRCRVSVYDERGHKGLMRHIYVRTNQAGEALLCVLCNGRKLPQEDTLVQMARQACPTLVGVVLGSNTRGDNVILGDSYRTLWGQDFLMDTLCGLKFRLSVPSFYQVNRCQAEVLYGRAVAMAELHGTETVLDLYCGIGTISLVMAQKAKRVIGAEIVPEAIADAEENARRNGMDNASFLCADAGAVAEKLRQEGLTPDVVCVDPPRKGLSEGVAATIARMNPQRIVYVSCDPATLGRDCKRFAACGYAVTRAEAVDMFPGTSHVETVLLLSQAQDELPNFY